MASIDATLPAGDAETQRRARILLGFAYVAALLLVLLLPLNAVVAPQATGPAVALLAIMLCIPVLVQRFAALHAAGFVLNGALFALMHIVAVLRGGLQSATLGWLPVCVVVGALTLSTRSSMLMTLVWAASNFVHALRVDPATWDNVRFGPPLAYAAPRALACLATLGLVAIFEVARKTAFARLAMEQEQIRSQRDEIALGNARLSDRNRDLRLVLDTIDQGLLVLDKGGVVADERSRVLESWFGPIDKGERFSSVLQRFDRSAATNFDCAWEFMDSDMLPIEVLLGNMPTRAERDGRTLQLEFRPLDERAGELRFLVVITDISPILAQARADAKQREMLVLFEQFTKDRRGVRAFFADASGLLQRIMACSQAAHALGDLHTFKGNVALFGLGSLARLAHQLEEQLALGAELDCKERAQLQQAWAALESQAGQWLNEGQQRMDIAQNDFDQLQHAIATGVAHVELGHLLQTWSHEDVALRLQRLRARALELASRLGKDNVQVLVSANGVRLDPARWDAFWNVFVHVVTNAIDHGLEPAEERVTRGKEPVATLRLEVEQVHGEVVIRSRDDGRGIDWEKLAAKAAARGLVVSGPGAPVELLFEAGLSSREQATESAGRGIGMSAVKAVALALGARIDVRSERGQFTLFEFRIPSDGASRVARVA